MTIHEAEALSGDDGAELHVEEHVPLWRTLVFAFIGLLEMIIWLATGAYNSILSRPALNPFLNVFAWSYTVARPIAYPSATVPYDLFCIYSLQLFSEAFQLGGMLFTRDAFGIPLPSTDIVALHAVNLSLVVILLAVVLYMPMAIPSGKVNIKDIVSLGVCVLIFEFNKHLGSNCYSRRLRTAWFMDNFCMGISSHKKGYNYDSQ